MDGKFRFIANGKERILSPGDFVAIPKGKCYQPQPSTTKHNSIFRCFFCRCKL